MRKYIKVQKDTRPHTSRNNVVYKIQCNDCDASYVGQTSRQLKTRITEHRNHIRHNTSTRSVKRSVNWAFLIEIPGPENEMKADALANKLQEVFQDSQEIKISRPTITSNLRISYLDDSITTTDILFWICHTYNCNHADIIINPISRARNRMGTTLIKCPVRIANDLADKEPPLEGKYLAIKNRIINTLEGINQSRLRKLLRSHEIEDDKPSVFLQRLRHLAGGHCTDSVLRTLFLEQLPDSVRAVLAISDGEDLFKLALQADKVIELYKPSISALAVASSPQAADSIDQQIAELRTTIESVYTIAFQKPLTR
ncbi:hypothetical protein ALC62_11196 [Cyphomyrmex costatus]|uniref:GIY-YIG domain-containing protein n=1 Tax=Cyphomyrmex costatus TaxID=456900 RepID=A0A151ICR2_9HYME|nr:hypothetical protein ALC62_11196 [Cyphomyrmex costatus]